MNWFTNKIIAARSTEQKEALASEDSCCEHVEKDPSVAQNLRQEVDSFGPVSSYVCCGECEKKAVEAERNVQQTCCDCGNTFKMKDGIVWKWYDFYAPQGDEPVYICNTCKVLPKHINRVQRDNELANQEFDDDY